MRPSVVALGQGAHRIPSPQAHKQPFPQRPIRAWPPAFRLGPIKALYLSGDPRHDLGAPPGRLHDGVALERHADGGIICFKGTGDGTTGLNSRDGVVDCLV